VNKTFGITDVSSGFGRTFEKKVKPRQTAEFEALSLLWT